MRVMEQTWPANSPSPCSGKPWFRHSEIALYPAFYGSPCAQACGGELVILFSAGLRMRMVADGLVNCLQFER